MTTPPNGGRRFGAVYLTLDPKLKPPIRIDMQSTFAGVNKLKAVQTTPNKPAAVWITEHASIPE